MGAYLTTSILTKLSVSKSDLQKLRGNILDKKKLIEAKIFHSDEALLDCNESEQSYDFNVKEGILEKDLPVFLKKFYG